MRLRWRGAAMTALLAASVFVLAGCPKPYGYQPERAFPQLAFDEMLGLYPIPGDGSHALILTRRGAIWRANLNDPAEVPTLFLDLSSRLPSPPAPEEGLLGLAFPPDHAASRRLYVYYSAPSPRRSVLSRFVSDGASARLDQEQVLLEIAQPYDNHNGGALAFGPDGYLYVALGDGGAGGDPFHNGQSLDTLLGKILRIDVSGPGGYTVPFDNPLANGGGRGEIFAWGFRNPWRISFDAKTGQLWTGDVGQLKWEEVDRVMKSGNYGWSVLEGNECYRAPSCLTAGMIAPRHVYGHDEGCAIIGGYVYHGRAMPEMDDWYVFGDFCSGKVWALDASADAGDAVPLMDTPFRISSFAQDQDGELYLVTFDNAMYRIVRKP